MTDRPILFSAPMVRALLAGTKTQTRRILKPQPIGTPWFWEGDEVDPKPAWFDGYERGREPCGAATAEVNDSIKVHSVGDRLYVREHWRTESRAYNDLAPSDMDADYDVIYAADADWSLNKSVGKHRQAMHMPRWASRLTLTVTNVRVQRLQDISEADAIDEGCQPTDDGMFIIPGQYNADGSGRPRKVVSAISAYDSLWQMINGAEGPKSWDANPWIVAYTFRVINGNIDQIGGDA